MFPVQFTYELNIPISCSIQIPLAGPILSQTFHSVCFLFSIYFFMLYLNLLEDSDRKSSGPTGLLLAPSLTSLSVVSFYWIPLCPGTHIMVNWFTSHKTVSFSIQTANGSDFLPLAAKAATAAWLSVQIVICSTIGLFLRQLVTQSSIATTSAWKEMCHCAKRVPKLLALSSYASDVPPIEKKK